MAPKKRGQGEPAGVPGGGELSEPVLPAELVVPKTKKRRKPETAFSRRLQLELCKIPGVRLYRQNAGRFLVLREDGSEGWVEGAPLGASDLVGIVGPEGWFLAVEVKARRGVVTKGQESYLAMVAGRGGVGMVARPEVKDLAKAAVIARQRLELLLASRRHHEKLDRLERARRALALLSSDEIRTLAAEVLAQRPR